MLSGGGFGFSCGVVEEPTGGAEGVDVISSVFEGGVGEVDGCSEGDGVVWRALNEKVEVEGSEFEVGGVGGESFFEVGVGNVEVVEGESHGGQTDFGC